MIAAARLQPERSQSLWTPASFVTKNIHHGRIFAFLLHLSSGRSQDINGHDAAVTQPLNVGRCAHEDMK